MLGGRCLKVFVRRCLTVELAPFFGAVFFGAAFFSAKTGAKKRRQKHPTIVVAVGTIHRVAHKHFNVCVRNCP